MCVWGTILSLNLDHVCILGLSMQYKKYNTKVTKRARRLSVERIAGDCKTEDNGIFQKQ